MLHDYHRKPSVHVVDKVRYLVLYKAKLDGFRDKLPAHRESICVIQELIQGQSPRERRESTVKLCGLIEEHEKQAELQDEYDRAQREVVKMFEERLPPCKNTRHPSSSEMLKQLEEDLVAKGVPREKAHELLFPITKALLLQPLVLSSSQKPREPKPTFKLDVFETVSHTTTAGDLHRCTSKETSENEKESILTNGSNGRASSSDNLSASPGTKNECWALQKVSPVKEVNATLVIPEIKGGVVQRSTTASPIAFLTRRRPLLTEQGRTKSSEFFASWIDPKRVSPCTTLTNITLTQFRLFHNWKSPS